MADEQLMRTLHASCVALGAKAALITGASGSGKSALALQLMALGMVLVSDDRTLVRRDGTRVIAAAPDTICGLIEARGLGLLRAEVSPPVPLVLVVDMDITEADRLPRSHHAEVCGVALPCLHKVDAPYFPAAVLQYLKGGRRETT